MANVKELKSYKKQGRWSKVKLLEGKKGIEVKWVFRTKENGTKMERRS